MSDVILERIAKALESIAAAGAVKPAAPAAAAKPAAAPAAAKPAATPAAAGKAAAAAPAAAKPAAAKPAAAKPAAPAAPAKAAGGKYNSDQVRDIIRQVATNPGLGKQSALDLLDSDGGGVTNVTNLKPEYFDAVFEAASALLSSEGSGEAPAADEFDPTA